MVTKAGNAYWKASAWLLIEQAEVTPTGSKRLVVCMPTRDGPSAETQQALRDNMDGFIGPVLTVVGKPVDEARNELAVHTRLLVSLARKAGADAEMVLWVDDDAWWPAGTVARLADDLARFPESVVMGSFCRRLQYDGLVATRLDNKDWFDKFHRAEGNENWLIRSNGDKLPPEYVIRDEG
jgi:hypothetical protein